MAVAGELCTSRLCSSSFSVFFFPPPIILRLFIVFFYVHTFDDAWYVEICSSKPPAGSIYEPPTIYKAILLNRVPSFLLTRLEFVFLFPRSF
jgi:hypothetical protein